VSLSRNAPLSGSPDAQPVEAPVVTAFDTALSYNASMKAGNGEPRTWDLGRAFFWAMLAGALYLLQDARSGSAFPGAMSDQEIVFYAVRHLLAFAALFVALALIRNALAWLVWRRSHGNREN